MYKFINTARGNGMVNADSIMYLYLHGDDKNRRVYEATTTDGEKHLISETDFNLYSEYVTQFPATTGYKVLWFNADGSHESEDVIAWRETCNSYNDHYAITQSESYPGSYVLSPNGTVYLSNSENRSKDGGFLFKDVDAAFKHWQEHEGKDASKETA